MSAGQTHTYGPKCRLAPVSHPLAASSGDGIPPITAQYFYSSIVPIDDPLAPGAIAGASDARSTRGQLRPFSLGDNNALEKAWLGFPSDEDAQAHQDASRNRTIQPSTTRATAEKLSRLVRYLAAKHKAKHGADVQTLNSPEIGPDDMSGTPVPVCCPELFFDVSTELQNTFCALARKRQYSLGQENVVQAVMMEMKRLRPESKASSSAATGPSDLGSLSRPRADSGRALIQGSAKESLSVSDSEELSLQSRLKNVHRETEGDKRARLRSTSQVTNRSSRPGTPTSVTPTPSRPFALDDGISGKPFVRVGAPEMTPEAAASTSLPQVDGFRMKAEPVSRLRAVDTSSDAIGLLEETGADDTTNNEKYRRDGVDVAVGISRLHMVSLPALQMKPIYWSPVNDIAVVLRATWFYRDTMIPIPPAVANQLEAGYRELRPYTETWNDELRCAIDVGPLGEEKVSHRLWPEDPGPAHQDKEGTADPHISADPFCAARCFRGEASAEGSIDAGSGSSSSLQHRSFSSYHVIYQNKSSAFLLKPSLKPSAYYGRRPVAKIMKGITIGIPVVRGFDRTAWERVHNKKTAPEKEQQAASAASNSYESTGQGVCTACKAEKERGQVTDLVLVAHGIGQKFAERVESFHFTHAINAFRREVNLELGNPAVKGVLRDSQNGIMVLPVNWRHTLSLEDGGPMKEEDKATYTPEGFSLKDIEPSSIPAVRSMISDVMFDIPFYMSHHKSKMIEGLTSEANRVYRLWCRNNPGFAENGRVHMIGHSLGSAMAIEILSKQPTKLPPLDLTEEQPQAKYFEFDTKNLFLVGSPAAFFLLLERGMLIPRRGRMKPGADPADVVARDVTGEAGTFGCVAVDNIYNVLAKEDPIAYLLNGTIDPVYSASLKVAYVPSTAVSIFKFVGDAMRSLVPGAPPPTQEDQKTPKPPTVRLPSQLELEVHDFSREEIVERKAYLLNDNGQLDYYLRSGGGPLEIQYLNMLSAHTSYWTSQDFIRMLCMEIGRKPGRAHTLPAMRAQKAAKRMTPTR